VFPALQDLLQRPVPGSVLVGVAAALLLTLLLLGLEVRRRRRVDRAVRMARGQLRTVTATMREGVIAYDLDRRFSFANPAFERLTGYPSEDLRDQEFLQYIHPDDRPALLAEWERLQRGEPLRDQEYRVVTRGRQVRWSSGSWEPLRDPAGRQIGYLGTEFDITERKLAEEAMRLDTELFQAIIEVQRSVGAAGLDSATVMRVIAEQSVRLTGAGGAVIETMQGDGFAPRVRVGAEVPASTGSVLSVPLQDEQQTLGLLKVMSAQANAFTDRDTKAVRLLGGLMGAALGHAAAFEARQSRLEERTRALQESEQRFKQLVDAAQEGIWVADDRGMITYVNQRMAEMLGYQNGALLGRAVYDFLDPGSRTGAQRALGRAGGAGDSHDLRFRRKDGSEVWGLVSASPILGRGGALVGTVGMVTDITERKRAEERLRRSAERLAVLHDLDQAILAARSPAEVGRAALGRMRRMVPCERCSVVLFDFSRREAQLIAGYAGGLALGATAMPLDQFAPVEVLRRGGVRYQENIATVEEPSPQLRQLLDEGMRSVLTVPLVVEGEPIGEVSLASASASAFDAEHRDIALEIATPLAIAIRHAGLRDELGRRTAELERRVAEQGAALRGATVELETLLYAISHDLRAPLRQIGGFAQLLLEDAQAHPDAAAHQYARRITRGTARLASLVDDLMHLAALGRQDLLRREIDLGTLVEDVVSRLEPDAAGRAVEWRIEELPTVDCDATLAREAVTQLLANALKFTRPRERAVITIRTATAEGQTGIAVQDNGVGFRTGHASKLFGIFQRLHRTDEFEGNGVGLALVQRIALRHGGRVWAESEPDVGATFYLTFGSPAGARRSERTP